MKHTHFTVAKLKAMPMFTRLKIGKVVVQKTPTFDLKGTIYHVGDIYNSIRKYDADQAVAYANSLLKAGK